MSTKIHTHTNSCGLEFELELKFVEKADDGTVVNDYLVDEYSFAKMMLYHKATKLLPPEKEAEEISKIVTIGVANYFKELDL